MKKLTIFLFAALCATTLAAQDRPAWVDKPSIAYPEKLFVSAVGIGTSRQSAESNAKGALTAYFRQSVSSKVNISDTEKQVNGRSVSESNMSQTIESVAALDNLIGAEIKNTWNDTRNRSWYAVAVMEKSACARLYAAELGKAISEINTLIDISGGVSLETISKCQKALQTADSAELYALILALLGGPERAPEVSRLATKVSTTLNTAKAIPVDVRVTGDKNGRIKAAFAKVFTAAGFKTGNNNSRYALEVTASLEPASKNQYYNARCTIDAVLRDTQTAAELFSYNFIFRGAHPASQQDAENRAIVGSEKKIAEEFPVSLEEYLAAN
ncbi:MAG: hypothetical protein LBT33_11350 [Spirochaetia bacterium]|nr:hypothetical protein [Spirochaetia bacterium]